MPNKNGEPATMAEANAAKQDWYSPAPAMIIKYSRPEDKWKAGPRCQSWDADSQCHNFALDKEKRACKAHGARPQALKYMEAQRELRVQKQERLNPYLNHPDPDVVRSIESFANDEGRKKLEDEILAARVAISISVKELQEEMDEGGRKGMKNPAVTKTILSMFLDLAKLEESKVKIETAEQYVYNPNSVKMIMFRFKAGIIRAFSEVGDKHTSVEARDALTDLYKMILELFGQWAVNGMGVTQLPRLVENTDDDTVEGEFTEG